MVEWVLGKQDPVGGGSPAGKKACGKCTKAVEFHQSTTTVGPSGLAGAEMGSGAHVPWVILLSNRAQDYRPRDGTTHNGLGPPPLIAN